MQGERQGVGQDAFPDRAVGEALRFEDGEARRAPPEVEERAEQPAFAFAGAAGHEHMLLRYPVPGPAPAVRLSGRETHDAPERPADGLVHARQREGHVVAPAEAARVDAREVGGDRPAMLILGAPVRAENDPPIDRMRGPEAGLALHDIAELAGDEGRVRRLAEIEPDRAVRLLPAIAVMEMEAGRQLVAALDLQAVLVHDQRAHAELRAPDMGVENGRVAGGEPVPVQHEGREQHDQPPLCHHEIVGEAERCHRQHIHLREPPLGVDAVEDQQRARHRQVADIPHRAVGLDLRMGGEGRAGDVLAPLHEALRIQRLRIEGQRRSSLPERHMPPAMDEHGSVGGVHVVGTPGLHRVGRHGAEGRQQAAPGLRFAAALGRVQDARPVGDAAAVETERLHHAVAVEPVAVAMAEAVMLGRAIAPERAGQFGRELASQCLQRCAEAFRLRRREGERLAFARSAGCARTPGGE